MFIVTDLANAYNEITKKLNVKHNLCIFHTKKYILDLASKSIPSTIPKFEREKKILQIVEPLFKALDSKSLEEAKSKIPVISHERS